MYSARREQSARSAAEWYLVPRHVREPGRLSLGGPQRVADGRGLRVLPPQLGERADLRALRRAAASGPLAF